MTRLKNLVDGIGRCPRCFRLSLQFAGALWATTIIAFAAAPQSWMWAIVATVALSATLIWLTHITLFTARASAKLIANETDGMIAGRRLALRTIGRSVAYGAGLAITLSVIRASSVRADEVPGCLQNALCDADHPCSGCSCHYPQGATTGYCAVD
jgi:hypothetical protein